MASELRIETVAERDVLLNLLNDKIKEWEEDFYSSDAEDESKEDLKTMIHLMMLRDRLEGVIIFDDNGFIEEQTKLSIGKIFKDLEPGLKFKIDGVPYHRIHDLKPDQIPSLGTPVLNLKTNKIEYFFSDQSTDFIDKE